jgi:ArsR family transcriptional regulator, arsenate/arsenite/antimonite-responsive transcriptional repressor
LIVVDASINVNGRTTVARSRTVSGVKERAECCPSVLAAPLGPDRASQLAGGFNALGDPVRLRLLSLLAAAPEGEICVCEFIQPIGKSQGTISHHLKILADANLVHGDRRGKWVWYSLDRGRLAELRGALEG